VSGDFFVLQQNSAPAHRSHETIMLLQWEIPAFLSPDLWPPNSPDLNSVDYKILGVMQDRVYQKKSEGCERVERATGWGLGRTATERDWRCHRPVTQTPAACVPAFGIEEDILSICCDCISYLGYGSWSVLKICWFIVKQDNWFRLLLVFQFLPRDASAERGNATVSRLSVRLSVRPWRLGISNT